MDTVVVLQARMGSTRLPGKAMLPLGGDPTIVQEIKRIDQSTQFDREDVLVATSERPQDDILEWAATRVGAKVYRGSESDVLGRINEAIEYSGADSIVRITADNPIYDPTLVDLLLETLQTENIDFISNKLSDSFPVGLGASAFTHDAIARVDKSVSDDHYREHMGKYFRDNRCDFAWSSVGASDLYEEGFLEEVPTFSDLRLTMDVLADYRLFSRVFKTASFEGILSTRQAVKHIVKNDLQKLNADVSQELS